jgi:Uma2 family endonuclease
MPAMSEAHNVIRGNVLAALLPEARKQGYFAYVADMKLLVSGTCMYYPDIMLVKGKGADDHYQTVATVVIEVLSEETARVDKVEKRSTYLKMDALELYLLVDSRKQAITDYYRTKQGWQERVFSEHETVPIPCADIELSFEDIYQQTEFAPST